MKQFSVISLLVLLIPLAGIGQNQNTFLDDIYFKPSDANKIQKTQVNKQKPSYKNGAKEIVFIERESPTSTTASDTTLLAQIYDSIPNDSQNTGYYLNEFNGNESDKEYAERIRRFHNPKYSIFIGDPGYNDIYFLNNSDWNVYVDDSYAYVTPTWTNPYWWNYNYGPMYGSWGYNHYSPDYGFFGWNNYPWSYNNFYGYVGFGGYYGYGYPYCYYGGYYGYGGGNYWGYGTKQKNNDDSNQRLRNSTNSRLGGYGYNSSRSAITSRDKSNQYTVISGSNNLSHGGNSRTISNSPTNVSASTYRSVSNSIGSVRQEFNRNSNGSNSTTYSINKRSGNQTINTRPRTTLSNTSNSYSTARSIGNATNSSRETLNSTRPTTRSNPSYNTSSGSTRTISPSFNSSSSSSSSYSNSKGFSGSTSVSGSETSSGSRSSGGGGRR